MDPKGKLLILGLLNAGKMAFREPISTRECIIACVARPLKQNFVGMAPHMHTFPYREMCLRAKSLSVQWIKRELVGIRKKTIK